MPSLDSLLSFADPSLCAPGPAHAALLGHMVAGDANEGFRPGRIVAPAGLRSAFGPVKVRRHDGYWTIGASVTGTLYGLRLVRIVHALPEGGDAGDVTYVFKAPVAAVEAALRSRGFPARRGQEVVMGPPDGLEHVMGLKIDPADRTRTLFGCGYR